MNAGGILEIHLIIKNVYNYYGDLFEKNIKETTNKLLMNINTSNIKEYNASKEESKKIKKMKKMCFLMKIILYYREIGKNNYFCSFVVRGFNIQFNAI